MSKQRKGTPRFGAIRFDYLDSIEVSELRQESTGAYMLWLHFYARTMLHQHTYTETVSRLAAELGVSPRTVRRWSAILESRGLVKRQVAAQDTNATAQVWELFQPDSVTGNTHVSTKDRKQLRRELQSAQERLRVLQQDDPYRNMLTLDDGALASLGYTRAALELERQEHLGQQTQEQARLSQRVSALQRLLGVDAE